MTDERSRLVIKLRTDDILELLGDSPEVRLEVSSSIVQRFTERHLKALVNHELMKKVETRLRSSLKRQVESQIGKWIQIKSNYMQQGKQVELDPKMAEKIQQTAQSAVSAHVREVVQEELAKWDDKIEAYVQQSLTANIRDRVNREVKTKLEAASKAISA